MVPAPEMCVEHGKNSAALENPWSTIVMIESSPLCVSSPAIKSMATTWNGGIVSSVGMWYSGMCFLCVRIFDC